MATLTIDKTKKWTIEDYQQLAEDTRCEIIDAELIMTPAPLTTHQRISRALFLTISNWVKEHKAGELFYAPIDVFFNRENVFQPDLLFIKKKNSSIIREKGVVGAPDMIAEIISPSDSYIDRYIKKAKYEQFGVKEYWIVDPGNKTLEVYSLVEGAYDLFLFLAEEGTVKSVVLSGISFELRDVFE